MLKMSDVLAIAAEQARALENSGAPLDQLNFTLVSIRWRLIDQQRAA